MNPSASREAHQVCGSGPEHLAFAPSAAGAAAWKPRGNGSRNGTAQRASGSASRWLLMAATREGTTTSTAIVSGPAAETGASQPCSAAKPRRAGSTRWSADPRRRQAISASVALSVGTSP
jgi:hypothetical protein